MPMVTKIVGTSANGIPITKQVWVNPPSTVKTGTAIVGRIPTSKTPTPEPIKSTSDTTQDYSSDGEGGSGGGGESSGSSFEPYEVDLEGIWELAGEYADNEINPQLEARQ